MIVTVANFKGGCGKTTTAVHLAAYFARRAKTLLIDGDANRSALAWHRRGALPFTVADERQAAKLARSYEHIVIDTAARPGGDDLRALVEGGDLLIVPTSPDALALDATMQLVAALKDLGTDRFRVLLTMVPPRPSRDGSEARAMLLEAGVPVLSTQIRRAVAFQKAALAGTVAESVADPRAEAAWFDYLDAGDEVIALENA